ncbi:hypothetical protein [Sphingomonas oryzagri]
MVEDGTRIAGVDRDSISHQPDGATRVTLYSFSAVRDATTTATGDFDVDCTKQRYQQIRVTILHGDGRRATILSRGPDWDTPANATDAALMKAACSLDFTGLTDIRNADRDRYAAERLKVVGGSPGQ